MIPEKINEFLIKWFGKSWSTTLVGILGGASTMLIPLIQGGTITSKDVIIAVVIGALGYLAKSQNVTGT